MLRSLLFREDNSNCTFRRFWFWEQWLYDSLNGFHVSERNLNLNILLLSKQKHFLRGRMLYIWVYDQRHLTILGQHKINWARHLNRHYFPIHVSAEMQNCLALDLHFAYSWPLSDITHFLNWHNDILKRLKITLTVLIKGFSNNSLTVIQFHADKLRWEIVVSQVFPYFRVWLFFHNALHHIICQPKQLFMLANRKIEVINTYLYVLFSAVTLVHDHLHEGIGDWAHFLFRIGFVVSSFKHFVWTGNKRLVYLGAVFRLVVCEYALVLVLLVGFVKSCGI